MEEIANLDSVLSEEPLSRDFRRKYQRKFTDQESKNYSLSSIYEDMGVGYYNKKKK